MSDLSHEPDHAKVVQHSILPTQDTARLLARKPGWQQVLRAARYAHMRGLEENAITLYHAGLQLADEHYVDREAVTNFLQAEVWVGRVAS